MEDTGIIKELPDGALLVGVFDGHSGVAVANYLKDKMPEVIIPLIPGNIRVQNRPRVVLPRDLCFAVFHEALWGCWPCWRPDSLAYKLNHLNSPTHLLISDCQCLLRRNHWRACFQMKSSAS